MVVVLGKLNGCLNVCLIVPSLVKIGPDFVEENFQSRYYLPLSNIISIIYTDIQAIFKFMLPNECGYMTLALSI